MDFPHFEITEQQYHGRIKFANPIIVTKNFGSGYDEQFEITGATYTFDDPSLTPPEAESGAHYYDIDPKGYKLTQKGERRKDQTYPRDVWIDYEDRKVLARLIARTFDNVFDEKFVWVDEVPS